MKKSIEEEINKDMIKEWGLKCQKKKKGKD